MSVPQRLTAIVLLLFTLPAPAQETPTASEGGVELPGSAAPVSETSPLAAKADELVTRIRERRDNIESLGSQAAQAAGEDQVTLREKVTQNRLELLTDLHALADNVVEQEERGLDASRYREPLSDVMVRVSPMIRERIEATETTLAELQEERNGAEGPALIQVEQRIAHENERLVVLDTAAVGHVEKLEALGLDATADREQLTAQLNDRAELLAARIERTAEEVSDARALSAQNPDDASLLAEFRALEAKLDTSTDGLSAAIQLMDRLGIEGARYKQVLIETTGEITADVFDREVALGLADRWMQSARNWFIERGPAALFKLLFFALILGAFWGIARFVRRVTQRAVSSPTLRFSELLKKMIASAAYSVVMVLGILVGLSQLGVHLGPVLAGMGIAGFVIGFALQDTLANFAAGVMILAYQPYDVGDLIEAAGVFGTVSRMNLVSTTILTVDHQTLVVPNGKIWGDVIKNVTAQTVRRVDLVFGISYGDDIPHTEEVLGSILKEHPKVLADPKPVVKLHNLGDSSVDFVVRPWVKTDDYWDVHWDITREVKIRFDREGISIPFPQRDVHVIPVADAATESLDSMPHS